VVDTPSALVDVIVIVAAPAVPSPHTETAPNAPVSATVSERPVAVVTVLESAIPINPGPDT